MAAKDFFDTLPSRADESKLAGMSNSYLFDIEGEGQWLVTVADGKIAVAEGDGEADATISTGAETFDKIVAGVCPNQSREAWNEQKHTARNHVR